MKTLTILTLLLSLSFLGCKPNPQKNTDNKASSIVNKLVLQADSAEQIATFAGGCFWCTEAVFERVIGIHRVISGYSGGAESNPTYRQVGTGNSQHAEAIQVYYDSSLVSYKTLLGIFFLDAHDPTQLNRQGPDVGKQYRSIAFYRNDAEQKAIQFYIAYLDSIGKFDKPIVTEVIPFEKFWPAEGYHQNFYQLNPNNPYIRQVARPKVLKFEKKSPELLK